MRYGANLRDTTSRREVFLPAAGTYDIAFLDSRLLYDIITLGNIPNNIPTSSDPAECYFATIEQRALPVTAFAGASPVPG